MPRIDYADTSAVPEAQRANMINVTRMLMHASPAVYQGVRALSSSFYSASAVSARLREIAILRVGYLSDSAYETFQHEAVARRIGITDAEIEALKPGGTQTDLDDEARAIVAFTDEMVRDIRVSDATLARIRGILSDQALTDLMLVVGFYMFVCRFLETTGVELDASPDAFKTIESYAK